MRYSEEIIAAILAIIDNNRDVSDIFQYGIGSDELLSTIKHLARQGYCIQDGNSYLLSSSGKDFLNSHGTPFTKREKKISFLYKQRIPRIKKETIYIPKVIPDL